MTFHFEWISRSPSQIVDYFRADVLKMKKKKKKEEELTQNISERIYWRRKVLQKFFLFVRNVSAGFLFDHYLMFSKQGLLRLSKHVPHLICFVFSVHKNLNTWKELFVNLPINLNVQTPPPLVCAFEVCHIWRSCFWSNHQSWSKL